MPRSPFRVTGEDPYRLDSDRDGLGCEVAGEGGGAKSPWGLILRNPPKKEAVSAKVGTTLRAVGWSPASFAGEKYELCAQRGSTTRCVPGKAALAGRLQTFGTWKVAAGESAAGKFKLSLRVKGKVRASDTVPLE
jgi:hypothetical protein